MMGWGWDRYGGWSGDGDTQDGDGGWGHMGSGWGRDGDRKLSPYNSQADTPTDGKDFTTLYVVDDRKTSLQQSRKFFHSETSVDPPGLCTEIVEMQAGSTKAERVVVFQCSAGRVRKARTAGRTEGVAGGAAAAGAGEEQRAGREETAAGADAGGGTAATGKAGAGTTAARSAV